MDAQAPTVVVPAGVRRPARLLRLASDERLVALVRGGDEAAFEALYDRHHRAILGFCRHMLGSLEEAEDAVQHAFLAAYGDLTGSTKRIELRAWLFTIARNRCLSMLRARREHVALDAAEPATDGLSATVERREDVRELLGDLARLPEDQRAALLLAELGALDHAGIATVLGCPREKVKALVFQARSSLAASREARATPCEQIRTELATASGGALRRGPLRRHLRECAGCQAFKAEVATQRKLLALALPVIPTAALKAGALPGGVALAAGTSATGAGVASSGGAIGSLLSTIASAGAAKVAVTVTVAGALAGGGAVSLEAVRDGGTPPVPSQASQPPTRATPVLPAVSAPSLGMPPATGGRLGPAASTGGDLDPAGDPGARGLGPRHRSTGVPGLDPGSAGAGVPGKDTPAGLADRGALSTPSTGNRPPERPAPGSANELAPGGSRPADPPAPAPGEVPARTGAAPIEPGSPQGRAAPSEQGAPPASTNAAPPPAVSPESPPPTG